MPSVLIVDDHPIVRMGVRAMLEQAPGFGVCGGADFVAQCLRACPRTRILVLSQHDEALYAERVLKAGAHGYLMKGEAMEDLLDAVETVLRGETAVSPRMNARLLAR